MLFLLLITFLLFYILSQRCIVRITNEEGIRIEIHMPLFAIVINPGRRKKSDGEGRKNRRAILAAVRRLIRTGSIKINRVILPSPAVGSPTRDIRYRILYSATISYIESISRGLLLSDNALTLSPDITSIQYDVSINSRLYEIIYAILRLGFHKIKERINVRE